MPSNSTTASSSDEVDVIKYALAMIFCTGLVSSVFAQECATDLLISNCDQAVSVNLRVLPKDPAKTSDLAVAGTYSSGDRFGIEGLAVRNGEIISRRFQRWDGVLVIDGEGQPQIFQSTNVMVGETKLNLKTPSERAAFLALATRDDLSVLQSHLLIANGALDLRDVENAPKFIRRILFTKADGAFGLYQSDKALTLFDAATDLMARHNPDMAFNLDMGAYDYCLKDGAPCGALLVPFEKLTNILEFSKPL